MIKKSKKQTSSIVLFSLFCCLLICSTVLPSTQAVEPSLQQEAINVLENVVGINTSKYDVTLSSQINSAISGRPKNELTFDLSSEQSRLQADVSFINNHFYSVRLPKPVGSTMFKQSEDGLLDMAKGFMNRYQSYTGNSLYGKLGAMLNDVKTVGNFTKTEGNVQLEVLSDVPDELYIMWTYIDDSGIRANPKNVGLSIYEGQLSAFYDYWQLYEIKGGAPKISSEEAVEIALNALEGFSWKAYTGENNELVTVSEFKVATVGTPSLSYLNYIDFASMDHIHYKDYDSPRGGDQFALYPSWYIQIGFDKVYPGSVTGANIRIWGDTGEVSTISPMSAGGVLPVENSGVDSGVATENSGRNYLGICVATMLAVGVLCACVGYVKVRPKKSLQKLRAIKVCAVVFCLVMSSSLLVSAVPQASAAVKISETYASDWGQLYDDMDVADYLCYYISYKYYMSGYDGVYNNFVVGTNWYDYYCNTWWDQEYGTFTTIFHYGHMADKYNLWLTDYKLYSSEVNDWVYANYKFGFVWLWACMQADNDQGPNVGMSAAWSNGIYLQYDDAYTTSDNVPYCFIGFEKISPSIFDRSFQGYNNSPAWFFIVKTYDYIASGKNIRNALDYASYDTFGCSYKYSPLYQGYQSWYPGNVGGGQQAQWANGNMRIYGSTLVQPVW